GARDLAARDERGDGPDAREQRPEDVRGLARLECPLHSADERKASPRPCGMHALLVCHLALEVLGELGLAGARPLNLALTDACDLSLELLLASKAPLVEFLPGVPQAVDLALLLGDLSLCSDASDLGLVVGASGSHGADVELARLLGGSKLLIDLAEVSGGLLAARRDPLSRRRLGHAPAPCRILL